MHVELKSLLESMEADMSTADALYQPTYYWKICVDRMRAELEQHGIEGFRSLPSALAHVVPTYFFADLASDQEAFAALSSKLHDQLPEREKNHIWLDDFLSGRSQAMADYRTHIAGAIDRRPFTRDASESDVGKPIGQLEVDGRRYSRSMLNYLLGLDFAKQCVDDLPVDTVLEIGGGFGTLGEILLQDSRNDSFYIDVDLPTTALLSTYYLRQVFGSDRVAAYDATRETESIDIARVRKAQQAMILCPWQLPRLVGQVDLFVNFISFQEMEPDVVANYLAQVDRLAAKYVLLRNIREGREVAREKGALGVIDPVTSGHYDEMLPGYDLVDCNVIPFGFATVDGFHSELRLFARRG